LGTSRARLTFRGIFRKKNKRNIHAEPQPTLEPQREKKVGLFLATHFIAWKIFLFVNAFVRFSRVVLRRISALVVWRGAGSLNRAGIVKLIK
jgi:hypothetical protein